MARPRKNLKAEDYATITELVGKGATQVQIARALGMSTRTLQYRLKDDEDAADAFKDGLQEEESTLVGILRDKAMKGDAVSAMFLLKTRHSYNERGNESVIQTGVSVQVHLPAALSPEAYGKLFASEAPAALPQPEGSK
jgi:hypothetical protein